MPTVQYYKKVGATYRNPHFPGVKSCLFLWMTRWWRMRQPHITSKKFLVFDMACGASPYPSLAPLSLTDTCTRRKAGGCCPPLTRNLPL